MFLWDINCSEKVEAIIIDIIPIPTDKEIKSNWFDSFKNQKTVKYILSINRHAASHS